MENLFWNLFEKSGNLDAFIAYKEFSKLKSNTNNINNECVSNKKDTVMR